MARRITSEYEEGNEVGDAAEKGETEDSVEDSEASELEELVVARVAKDPSGRRRGP